MSLAKQGSAATGCCSGGAESREIHQSLCPYCLQNQKAEVTERSLLFHTRLPQQASYLVSPVWTLDGLKSSLKGKQVVKHLAGETSPVSRLSLSTYSLTDKKKDQI